jgi:ribosomal protein S6
MPLETRAKVAAERLLLLTEAINEAMLNDRVDEIDGLLQSRQAVVDQIGTMDIDAVASAILAKVATAEADLVAMMLRTQGEATKELARQFSGNKSVKAYQGSTPKRLLRTG